MKNHIIYILILTTVFFSTSAQNMTRPSHHTDDGFRNPFPTYEDRNFADFVQWFLIDRIKGNKPDKPESYQFELIDNDGKFLRNNTEEYTVTWIGHSTLLIQLQGLNILTDPIWSERCSPLQSIGPKRYVPPAISLENLPKIDIVLISHNHYDHLDRLTIEKLGNKPLYLVPLKIGKFLEDLQITNYEEFDWWETIKFNGVKFICAPAQHFSNRYLMDRNKTLWCGWIIDGNKNNFYFAGDTGYFPGFKERGKIYGPFDFVALPIGAYLPRWFMGPVHLNPDEAIKAYQDLRGEIFLPIHWGTFDLADEPLDQPSHVLKAEIAEQKLDFTKFWILKHGETKIFKNEYRTLHAGTNKR